MKKALIPLLGMGLLLLLAFIVEGEATAPTAAPNPTATPLPAFSRTSAARDPGAPPPVAPGDSIAAGEALTFTVTVTNYGPSDATDVIVTDTLPSGVIFHSARPSQGTGCRLGSEQATRAGDSADASTLITCGLDYLAPGASATITFVVTPITVTGTLAHALLVAANEIDPDTSDNRFFQETQVHPVADLALRAQGPATVTAGGTLVYTLTVANHGPSPATRVTVTDTLPPGTAYAWSIPGQPTCTAEDDSVVCHLGRLESGATATVTLDLTAAAAGSTTVQEPPAFVDVALSAPTCALLRPAQADILTCYLGDLASSAEVHATVAVSVDPALTGTITHTTAVAANEIDPVRLDNTAAAGTIVIAAPPLTATVVHTGADLALRSLGPEFVVAGETLTHTLIVTNNGPLHATGVGVQVYQPRDQLPAGVRLTSITPGQPACTQADGAITCHLRRGPAGHTVGSGGTLTFTLLISSTADPVPQVTLDPVLFGWPVCTIADEGILCSLGKLAPGQDTQVALVADVSGTSTGTITSTATVRASEPDPNPGDNTITTGTRIDSRADLEIQSRASGAAIAGMALGYTLTITNHGPSDATAVIVTDTLPLGVTLVSAVPSHGGACLGIKDVTEDLAGGPELSTTVVCPLGRLIGGDVITVAIFITLDQWTLPSEVEALTNWATVWGDQADPNSSNNQVRELTPLNAAANLSIVNGIENQDTE